MGEAASRLQLPRRQTMVTMQGGCRGSGLLWFCTYSNVMHAPWTPGTTTWDAFHEDALDFVRKQSGMQQCTVVVTGMFPLPRAGVFARRV